MKANSIARLGSYLFHPLLMPSLGMLLLLNSGTYIALLDPAVKRALLTVVALGTFAFPILILPLLMVRNLERHQPWSFHQTSARYHLVIVQILFLITLFYFYKLPLSRTLHSYMLGINLVLMVYLLLSFRFRVSLHLMALGALAGLLLALFLRYQNQIQGPLICVILASGICASSLLSLEEQRPATLLAGFVSGFGVLFLTLLLY
ncbi:MAG: hypothetical protein R2751_00145 [Bacteroidales bacterium]